MNDDERSVSVTQVETDQKSALISEESPYDVASAEEHFRQSSASDDAYDPYSEARAPAVEETIQIDDIVLESVVTG